MLRGGSGPAGRRATGFGVPQAGLGGGGGKKQPGAAPLTSPRLYLVLLQLVDLHLGPGRKPGVNPDPGRSQSPGPWGQSPPAGPTMGDL